MSEQTAEGNLVQAVQSKSCGERPPVPMAVEGGDSVDPVERGHSRPEHRGTIWRFICPCGREHEYKRPVVSVDFLDDARRARGEIAAAAEAWDQTLSSYCDGPERDALRRAVAKEA